MSTCHAAVIVLIASGIALAVPLGAGFTYQGQLLLNGGVVNDTADFEFTLWDDSGAGNMIGSPVVVSGMAVVDGLFTVDLNTGGEFGASAFNGDARWLEVAVRSPAGGGAFTPLLPRQPVTAAPYALFALDTAAAGGAGDGHSLDAADGDPIDALFVDNDGKVGIATPTPSALLSLGTWNAGNAGPTTAFNPAAPPGDADVPAQLTLSGALNAGANAEGIKLLIEGYDNDDTLHTFPIVARDENAGIDFFLRARGAQGGSSLAYFQGKVGIGTTAPDTPLHVLGGDNDGTTAPMKIASDSGNSVMLVDGNEIDCTTGALLLNNNSPEDIWLATGGGNVGIGTTTPDAALHVLGSENTGTAAALRIDSGPDSMLLDGNEIDSVAGATGLFLNNNTNRPVILANGGGRVGIGMTSPACTLDVDSSTDWPTAIMRSASPTGTWFSLRNTSTGGHDWNLISSGEGNGEGAGKLLFRDQTAANTRMLIDDNGNVGIGTTTPQTALHVNGSENDGTTAALIIESPGSKMLFDGNEIDVTAGGALSLNRNVAGNIVLANGGGDVGIGGSPVDNRLFVVDTATGPNNFSDTYVTLMRNANTDGSVQQGLLWLEFRADLNGHAGNGNWIQFVEGNSAAGRIDNNNSGHAVFTTGGSDYAEALECIDPSEEIQNGDVVGVFGGRISRQTDGADWVMAVTGNAAVVGNQSFDNDSSRRRETVSFVGQVPVRVRGPVAIGDYVVASGRGDGIAMAVSPGEISPEQSRLIVGRAWGASRDPGVKRINTVVGLPEAHATTAALARTVRDLSGQVAELQKANGDLQNANADLARRMARLESIVAAQSSVRFVNAAPDRPSPVAVEARNRNAP
jgi:hypothetical protein